MKKGLLFASATAVISGVSVFANGFFVSRTDPVTFTFIRNLLVLLFLLIPLISSRTAISGLRHLDRPSWLKLIAIGVIGGGLPFALFFSGLALTGAVTGTLIHKSLFFWTALIAVPVLGERLTWKQLLGYAAVLFGTYGAAGIAGPVDRQGIAMVFAATILWAVENVIAKTAAGNISPVLISFARILFGLPFLFGAVLLAGKHPDMLPLLTAPQTIVSAVFLTGYMLSYYASLKYLHVTVAASILVIAPVITVFLTNLLKGMAVPVAQLFPFGLILIGISAIAAFRGKSGLTSS